MQAPLRPCMGSVAPAARHDTIPKHPAAALTAVQFTIPANSRVGSQTGSIRAWPPSGSSAGRGGSV